MLFLLFTYRFHRLPIDISADPHEVNLDTTSVRVHLDLLRVITGGANRLRVNRARPIQARIIPAPITVVIPVNRRDVPRIERDYDRPRPDGVAVADHNARFRPVSADFDPGTNSDVEPDELAGVQTHEGELIDLGEEDAVEGLVEAGDVGAGGVGEVLEDLVLGIVTGLNAELDVEGGVVVVFEAFARGKLGLLLLHVVRILLLGECQTQNAEEGECQNRFGHRGNFFLMIMFLKSVLCVLCFVCVVFCLFFISFIEKGKKKACVV